MTDAFKALSDPLRRLIVDELVERDGQTLFELCARLALKHRNASTRQAISHHLKLLEEAGIITTRRQGRTKVHHLRPTSLRSIAQRWAGVDAGGSLALRISQASVFVDDQERAVEFYTSRLGFTVRADEPAGEHRWIALTSPDDPRGPLLVLEPDAHPAIRALKRSLLDDGTPFTAFAVADVERVHAELIARGVVFTQPPVSIGSMTSAVLDDTCGNLLQIRSPSPRPTLTDERGTS